MIAWIKGAHGTNGKVVGFEKPQTGVAVPSTGTYDRMLYVDGTGNAWFGVYNDAYVAINSPAVVTNGAWHMLAGTLGPAGMRLYVDGVPVASDTNTVGEAIDRLVAGRLRQPGRLGRLLERRQRLQAPTRPSPGTGRSPTAPSTRSASTRAELTAAADLLPVRGPVTPT